VTLGNFATKLLLETKEGITKLRGREFAFERAGVNAALLPTLHPSAVLRSGGKALAEARADFVHVKRALARVTNETGPE
jgi:DNA polymerase